MRIPQIAHNKHPHLQINEDHTRRRPRDRERVFPAPELLQQELIFLVNRSLDGELVPAAAGGELGGLADEPRDVAFCVAGDCGGAAVS